jgi:hypothetical protein
MQGLGLSSPYEMYWDCRQCGYRNKIYWLICYGCQRPKPKEAEREYFMPKWAVYNGEEEIAIVHADSEVAALLLVRADGRTCEHAVEISESDYVEHESR